MYTYTRMYSVYTLVVGGVCLLHLWEFGSPNPVSPSYVYIITSFATMSTVRPTGPAAMCVRYSVGLSE